MLTRWIYPSERTFSMKLRPIVSLSLWMKYKIWNLSCLSCASNRSSSRDKACKIKIKLKKKLDKISWKYYISWLVLRTISNLSRVSAKTVDMTKRYCSLLYLIICKWITTISGFHSNSSTLTNGKISLGKHKWTNACL